MLNEKILKAELPKIKFGEDAESIYSFLQKEQLKKKNLWNHLVEQFIIQPDSKDGGWRGECEMRVKYKFNPSPNDTNLEPKR